MRTLDPTWLPLLGQVRDDRTLGFDIDTRPRPRAPMASVEEGVEVGVRFTVAVPDE